MNKWSGKKKILAILAGVLSIVGLIVTIYLVQRVQEIRSRAEKATTITLSPPSQNASPGGEANVDVTVNPGVNHVSFVKFTADFDEEKFDEEGIDFELNSSSSLKFVNQPVVKDGTISVILNVGSDGTQVIREPTKIGTLILPVNSDATSGSEQIGLRDIVVSSTRGEDPFTENVLSAQPTPVNIVIAGECRPDIATCSWDPSENVTTYRYKITNVTDNEVVLEDETNETEVEFESEPNKTYKCEVIAVNQCGSADPSSDEVTCEVPSGTPTPIQTSTPTPKATSTPTPIATSTPTPLSTATPTPKATSTPTPIPTTPVVNTATPTTPPEGGIETPVPTESVFVPTETPVPTLPPTGSPLVIGGVIGGVLFILGGLFLLFL
jgi:hypothetical protein